MSFRKIMALLVCVGTFLIGIGTGISFLEYSQFTYGGKQELYADRMTVDVFTFELDEPLEAKSEEFSINGNLYYQTEVVSDSSISGNQIVFEATYNKEFGKLDVTKEEKSNVFSLSRYDTNRKSDLEIFMNYKDRMLNDIKNMVITEYTWERVVNCIVRVGPQNVEMVKKYLE